MNRFAALPDKMTVKQAADFLILTYGKAEPSIVKERLEKQGFFLNQNTVSTLLELIAEEQGWVYCRRKAQEEYYCAEPPKNRYEILEFSLN